MDGTFSMPLLVYKIKSKSRNLLIWSIISLCLFILIIVMFTNLLGAGLPDLLGDMLASFPTAPGEDKSIALPDFKDFGVNFGVCMQMMLIVGCIYASYLGASANNGGRGDSDITFVYALPVSRVCTVVTSFFAQLVTLFFYNIVVLLVSVAVLYSNNKMHFIGKIFLAVAAFLLIEAIYMSISFLLSGFLTSGVQASSISAVVVTLTIFLGILGSLAKSLKLLKILSPYSYISVYNIVSGGEGMFYIGIAAGLLITVVSLVLSCVRYDKIDFII